MNKEIRELDEMLEALNEAEEDVVLTEVTVYRGIKDNIYIGIFNEGKRNFIEDPYFKVSWRSFKYGENDTVARISMRTGDYVIHNNISATLDKDVVKAINNIMLTNQFTKANAMHNYKINNVWEALLFMAAYEESKLSEYENMKIKFPYRPIAPNPETLKRSGCTRKPWGKD